MKRVFFGILWFVAFSLVGSIAGGAVAGAIAGSQVEATTVSEGYAKGQEAGHAAGVEFANNYGGLVLLGSLVLAIAGTATGRLPGTRKKEV